MNTMIGGLLAQNGTCDESLLNELNDIDYYDFNPPKSLAREFAESQLLPLLSNYDEKTVLHTYTKHIGFQIGCRSQKAKQPNAWSLVVARTIVFSSIKSSSTQDVFWKSPIARL